MRLFDICGYDWLPKKRASSPVKDSDILGKGYNLCREEFKKVDISFNRVELAKSLYYQHWIRPWGETTKDKQEMYLERADKIAKNIERILLINPNNSEIK